MRFKLTFLLSILVYWAIFNPVVAQWSGKYGNEWISYDKTYIKVNVMEAGLYKLPMSLLPADFVRDISALQMWHRGKEVSIVQVDSKELWFYAELNDGSSDSLFFRPASARMNPYQSFFSDQGVYFITTAKTPKRAVAVEPALMDGIPEEYSLHTEVKSLRNQFSFSTLTASPLIPNSSFYENINTWTGPIIYGDSAVGRSTTNIVSNNTFTLADYKLGTGMSPTLNVMLNGLHHGRHQVQVLVGRTASSSDLKELTTINFSGLGGIKKEGLVLTDDKFLPETGGVISLRSKSGDLYDWFSLTYFTVTYPKKIKLTSGKASYFNFQPSSSKRSRIAIETASDRSMVLDVSDPYEPKLLNGVQSTAKLELMVPRTVGAELRLYATPIDQVKSISSDKVTKVDFSPLFATPSLSASANVVSPDAYDYLVITSDTLKEAAIEYAKYRGSELGGKFRTIVYDSRNIYNQFNYGEPSPAGIKRFVEFMLKSGIRSEHNLLLVGISVTAPDAGGLRLKKDLPNEVPTIGDPGADILLVSGLHGEGENYPAIPVGRISAFNQQQVISYLNKVKEFEADKSDRRWQKKVLHLNGGKSSNEINELSSILRRLSPIVENGEFAGEVKAFVKQTTIETEKVDISKEVNEGVGLISYFGHGSPLITDLDMGKASDASRNYSNPGKYPLMYFNGCGVGNVYSGRSTITLSTDWVLSPNVGAIATIANSYNSYVSPTTKHLNHLYQVLFEQSGSNLTIGKIVQNVAFRVLKSSPDSYDITNIHQSNLQGDPAIRLFNFSYPDYSLSHDKPLIITSESPAKTIGTSAKVRLGVIINNYGRLVKDQRVPLNIEYFFKNGLSESRLEYFISSSSIDTVFFDIPDGRSVARVRGTIDSENKIVELNKSNNSAELNIDWDAANRLQIYPEVVVKDVVAPTLIVNLNGRSIKNEEVLLPNPVLTVSLNDDRSLAPDLTTLEVYVKPCWSDGCDYQRADIGIDDLKLSTDGNVALTYPFEGLNAGDYEILVTGKDKAGNYNSYNIRFSIRNPDNGVSVIVSPNPASEFVQFETDIKDTEMVESITYSIFNLAGVLVNNATKRIFYNGRSSWYWERKGMPFGTYVYQIDILRKGGDLSKFRGKFILR